MALTKTDFLLPTKITKTMQAKAQVSDKVAKQFLPDERENIVMPYEIGDPIGDYVFQPLPGIVHRYTNRCLLLPLKTCPVYCRFCFRREQLGAGGNLSRQQLEDCFAYIAANDKIEEVILSGGDPLMLQPQQLEFIFQALAAIKHVNIVRVHTRVPVVSPEKISTKLLEAINKFETVYILIHTNHVDEWGDEALAACKQLTTAGILLLSQTVLLKGVNDNFTALSDLMRFLLKHKIKPYYLHQADLARGTSHFRVSLQQGLQLMAQLQAELSGLCVPNYMIDLPQGQGKISVSAENMRIFADGTVKLKNHDGVWCDYINVND